MGADRPGSRRNCRGRRRSALGRRTGPAPAIGRPGLIGQELPASAKGKRHAARSASLTYAYRDRKNKKRAFRRLWIIRINAGARANGLSYNQFIAGLKAADVELDRKVLADLAITDPAAFSKLADQAEVGSRGLTRHRP